MSTFHVPVLVKEVIEGLGVREGGKYIDATVGGGGHGIEILKSGGRLLGIDADSEAIAFTKKKIDEGRLIHGNFRDIERIAEENGFEKVDGILFDLGVSSYQLDTPERGFSYRFDGPLDLRFDKRQSLTAREVINTFSEDELYEIFARYGEEQLARPIAHALVRTRRMKPIVTSGDLVDVVTSTAQNIRDLPSILSRVYQALRILVNDELTTLREGLGGAEGLLKPGGRLAVISFHSLEDRVVKQTIRATPWRMLTKDPVVARDEEIIQNRRARSAKLRIAEKI